MSYGSRWAARSLTSNGAPTARTVNPGTTVSALLSSRVLSPAHLSESRGVLGAVGQKEPGIVGEYAFVGPSGVGSLPVVEL